MQNGDRVRLKDPENGPFDRCEGVVSQVRRDRIRVTFDSGAGRTYHRSKLTYASAKEFRVKTDDPDLLAAGVPEDLPPIGTPYLPPFEDQEEVDTDLETTEGSLQEEAPEEEIFEGEVVEEDEEESPNGEE